MSKYQFDDSPIYITGTDIPKNKINVTDSDLIHEIENNLLKEAYKLFLSNISVDTKFNEKFFINLHKKTYELNGRILRLFCDLLSVSNGYKLIDYSNAIDNNKYIEASIDCVQLADSTKLQKIIFEGLSLA